MVDEKNTKDVFKINKGTCYKKRSILSMRNLFLIALILFIFGVDKMTYLYHFSEKFQFSVGKIFEDFDFG